MARRSRRVAAGDGWGRVGESGLGGGARRGEGGDISRQN